jgi:hypothetical protein
MRFLTWRKWDVKAKKPQKIEADSVLFFFKYAAGRLSRSSPELFFPQRAIAQTPAQQGLINKKILKISAKTRRHNFAVASAN